MSNKEIELIKSETKLGVVDKELFKIFNDKEDVIGKLVIRQRAYNLTVFALIVAVLLSIWIAVYRDQELGLTWLAISVVSTFVVVSFFRPMEILLKSFRHLMFGDENDAMLDEIYTVGAEELGGVAERHNIDISEYSGSDEEGEKLDLNRSTKFKNLLACMVIITKYFEDRDAHQKQVGADTIDILKKHSSEMSEKEEELRSLKERVRLFEKDVSSVKQERKALQNSVSVMEKQLQKSRNTTNELNSRMDTSREKYEKQLSDLSSDLKREKEEHIQTRENFLSSTTPFDLVRHMTEWLQRPGTSEIKLSNAEQAKFAAMYAAMHEFLPDKERVKELSLVPHEALRAQQVETIVSHYSALITAAENDDNLSSDEREDKANAYRMARESELQAFHGGG